jgi:hypothetical protein
VLPDESAAVERFLRAQQIGITVFFSQLTLVSLIDDADHAYQDARWRVWDQLVPGQPIDVTRLSESQQSSLTSLHAAETAVAQYRALAYADVASATASATVADPGPDDGRR